MNLLGQGEYGPMVQFFQSLFGLACCCGLPFLLVFGVGFRSEQRGSSWSVLFRCRERHPQHGRCALEPHHWKHGHPWHRGRNGRTWR